MLLCMHVELARLLGVNKSNKSQMFTANTLIGKELKAFTSQIHVTIYLQSQIFTVIHSKVLMCSFTFS